MWGSLLRDGSRSVYQCLWPQLCEREPGVCCHRTCLSLNRGSEAMKGGLSWGVESPSMLDGIG